MLGITAFQTNFIQLGLDQFMDALSRTPSITVYWFILVHAWTECQSCCTKFELNWLHNSFYISVVLHAEPG